LHHARRLGERSPAIWLFIGSSSSNNRRRGKVWTSRIRTESSLYRRSFHVGTRRTRCTASKSNFVCERKGKLKTGSVITDPPSRPGRRRGYCSHIPRKCSVSCPA